jgi:hypothetical protein
LVDAVRDFEVGAKWSNPDHTLTARADGLMRALSRFMGASEGSVPIGSLGGDGVSTTSFLREDGNFAVPAYPIGGNPTASVGLVASSGAATTWMRSDAAPALSLSITPTWTGAHNFSAGLSGTTAALSGAFGCNNKAAQTSATVNAAIAGTAGGAYTATEQGLINGTVTLLNQIRAALVANGIAV